jgi:FkbM family methyltransferase
MKIKTQSYLYKKLRNLFWVLFHKMENNCNSDFKSNGEEDFINSLLKKYNNSKLTIFDIGANIGKYTDILLDKSKQHNVTPTIHVFEPTSNCFKILEEKFQKNQSVILNKTGISDKEGNVTIYFDKEGSSFASLYQRDITDSKIKLSQQENIQLTRLDNYIEANKIEHIHFLKIDIEGHDLSGLKSLGKYLNNNFIDYIQFEYGGTTLDAKVTLHDFFNLLDPCGFTISKVKSRCLEIREYETLMENFNYANYIAISKKILE